MACAACSTPRARWRGSNELLEERVVERTRELRAVLDNVEQALFTVDLDGRLARERSAVLDAWFPAAQSDSPAVGGRSPNRSGGGQLAGGRVGAAARRHPARRGRARPVAGRADVVTTGRQYRVDYRPIGDPRRPDKVLVVISDVTEQRERERREAEQQEHLMMFQHARIDGAELRRGVRRDGSPGADDPRAAAPTTTLCCARCTPSRATPACTASRRWRRCATSWRRRSSTPAAGCPTPTSNTWPRCGRRSPTRCSAGRQRPVTTWRSRAPISCGSSRRWRPACRPPRCCSCCAT